MIVDTVGSSDHLSLVAPLGVRFWDELAQALVSDGLAVSAHLASDPAHRVQAVLNTTSTFTFAHLPGMRSLERGAGDDAYWVALSSSARRHCVVEVVDPRGRFQPCQFHADVPTRGLFAWVCGSPGAAPRLSVPLFSAPGRAVPAAMAVVRAELWDPLINAPAAWAVLEARPPGLNPVRGIADAAGRVALIFAYPEPAGLPVVGSPGPTSGPPLTRQTWPVQLVGAYARQQSVPAIPDLCATLSQPPGTLWADAARTQTLTTATLSFGQELVVRSQDAPNRPLLPKLLITPAGSPL